MDTDLVPIRTELHHHNNIVMTYYDPASCQQCATLKAARINKFYKHSVSINNEVKDHIRVSLSWFQEHPQMYSCGKPVTIWYKDIFQTESLIPVQLISSRAVSLVDKLNGELVLFVVPCIL